MNEFFNKVKEFVINNKKAVIITSAAVLLAVIVLVTVLLLVGGEEPSEGPDPTDPAAQTQPVEEKVEYKITVSNQIGAAISDLGVSVFADSTMTDMVWFGKTGDDGSMTFSAAPSDAYVAVLESASAGYAVQESYPVTVDTQIVLSASGGSIQEMTGSLVVGDPVPNFTVTTLDGTTYTLSDLVSQGKPVVLNFWFESCEPCKAEFPHLQEAYAQYSDEVILLALNTEDSQQVVEEFAQTSGVDLPFAVGDTRWKDLLNIIAYPTTAVIDRFGHLSVVHTGTLPDTQIFLNLFEYYTDVNYRHTTFDNLDQFAVGAPGSTAENPMEFSGATSYQITLDPGQELYCAFYSVRDMQLQISSANAYVIYGEQTYNAENGAVALMVTAPDTFTPVAAVIGNNGTETETFTVDFTYLPGSMGAPFELAIGPATTEIAAGNSQGVYYTYTCTANGKLTVAVAGATEGIEYNCVLYNQTTGTMISSMSDGVVDEVTGFTTITVDVNANDVVQLVASTLMDANNEFPAATLELEVSFTDGAGTIGYTVTVTDKNGFAIPGVVLTVTGDGVDMDITTDAEGVASVALAPGTYTVIPNIPLGYQAEATSFEITEAAPELSIILENVSVIPGIDDPGVSEPSDVTDPAVPTDPLAPTDPTTPSTSTTPVVRPTTPSKPSQSTTPADPTDPPVTERPDDPANPPATQRPTSPARPTDPTDPPATQRPTDPPATQRPTEASRPTDPPATEPPQTEPQAPTYTPNPDVEGETRENPLWLGNETSHTITVKAGYTVYLCKIMVEERYMQVEGESYTLVINAPEDDDAETLYPENGKIAQTVAPEGIGTTLYLDLTNTSNEDRTYTISFVSLPGTYMNPYTMKLGSFELKVKKGTDDGVWYNYTATEDGVFTLECTDCTDGVVYYLQIDNMGGGNGAVQQQRVVSTDGNSISIEVSAGDRLRINIGTIENESGARNPKATFQLKASFED